MSMYSELKRRNVFRIAILYIVVVWVILQIAEVAVTLLELPVWVGKLIFLLAFLGFIPALIFSWVYELTPDGLKREHEVAEHERITHKTGGKINTLIGVFGALAVITIVADRLMPEATTQLPTTNNAAQVDDKSIAVLPFADMSPDGDQEYFSDGISEELLDLLAKIPALRVIGRTSSFQFKGHQADLREIAQKLDVAHLLEGSVRKAGDQIRVTAQLIRARDGSHLWSQTYNRELDDIFAVQDDIAGAVVSSLRVQLLGESLPERRHTPSPEVHSLYLQGRFFSERGSREDLERAADYLEQVLQMDPDFALAWATLSTVYSKLDNFGVRGTKSQASAAALNAIERDPQLADGYVALAYVAMYDEWDWDKAENALASAMALDPGDALVLRRTGDLTWSRKIAASSLEWYEKSIARDPLRPGTWNNFGLALTAAGQLDEAEKAFRRARGLTLDLPGTGYNLARVRLMQLRPADALIELEAETEPLWRIIGFPLVLHALGRSEEADAALSELINIYADEAAYQVAEAYAFRGEKDKAFEWLDRAYSNRDSGMTEMKADPLLRPLHGDPRFDAMLRKMELDN